MDCKSRLLFNALWRGLVWGAGGFLILVGDFGGALRAFFGGFKGFRVLRVFKVFKVFNDSKDLKDSIKS